MSDRAVFDVTQILADLMPLDELVSIKFGVRLIDPSLLINRIWREYYKICHSSMKLFLHSTVIDILFSLEILFGVSFDMNML